VFTAARAVPESFRPRAAAYRVYHYHEVVPRGPLATYRAVARLAEREVDVRSFGRGIPSDRPLRREITRSRVVRDAIGYRFEFQAPSFVWGMVRKLVATVRSVVAGQLPRSAFEDALAGRRRLTLPMAEPAPLVLWEVRYPGRWTHLLERSPALGRRYFSETISREQARVRVLTSVAELAATARVPPPSHGRREVRPSPKG
jgi:tRNA U38,U39,U40 pseudouridine synthase TruA